ncbi:MAG: hypothetical protein QM713_14740 [Arachnia sp.]
MPDRIPQLDDLARSAGDPPHLTAAEIRRLGDRRRLHRRALTGVAAVAVFAVGSVAVWNSPMMAGLRGPQWANTPAPTPSTEQPLDPLTSPSQSTPPVDPIPPSPTDPGPLPPAFANLPTAEMFNAHSEVPWIGQKDEYVGPGTSGTGICDPETWGAPTLQLVREFGNAEDKYGTSIWATVLGYPSVQLAEEGFKELRDGVAACPQRIADEGHYPDPAGYDDTDKLVFDTAWAGSSDTDHAFLSSVGMSPGGEEPGIFNDTLLVRAGERVLWVTQDIVGWDHNCSVAPDDPALPEQCLLPAATKDMVEALVVK